MARKVIFPILVLLLLLGGGFGVFTIVRTSDFGDRIFSTPKSDNSYQVSGYASNLTSSDSASVEFNNANSSNFEDTETLIELQQRLVQLLDDSLYSQAVSMLDDEYSLLSTNEIQNLNNLFLSTAIKLINNGASRQAEELLKVFNDAFNNLDGWVLLSNIHLTNKDYPLAIDALLKATALEYRPEQLTRLMQNLTAAASQEQHSLSTQENELAINDLYQKLYDHHPDVARFQLELAMSYFRLEDTISSQALLEPLQYDPELGGVAKKALAAIQQQTVPEGSPTNPSPDNRNKIIVPLVRAGNSFIVTTQINNRKFKLLLDTGASITALSQSAIYALNLQPSGRKIQLNTANGTRTSDLYSTNSVKLGRLSVSGLVVAGIEMESHSGFDGLLGTDLLNSIDQRYSYVIDNQKNALIFVGK